MPDPIHRSVLVTAMFWNSFFAVALDEGLCQQRHFGQELRNRSLDHLLDVNIFHLVLSLFLGGFSSPGLPDPRAH